MKKLEGNVALVTASTKGIGLASAKILAANGCTVYISARSRERADEVINGITKAGGKAKFAYFNAREPKTYTTMIEEAVKAEGRLDILVNNYGATDRAVDLDLLSGDTDAFFRIVQENLESVYLPSKAAVLPGMIMTDALKNNMTAEFQNAFLRHVPLNQVGKPEDIANAVLFFAGSESSYITGHILDVAGGFGVPTPMYGDNLMR